MAMDQTSMAPPARRARPSGLADVIELILDKGLVIDAYVRVSVIGIELLVIDARIVVASVDTYLRFAEAVNRLDLTQSSEATTLPDLKDSLTEGGSRGATKGAIEGAKESIFGKREQQEEDRQPAGDGDRSRSR
jgi:hypothetical protein